MKHRILPSMADALLYAAILLFVRWVFDGGLADIQAEAAVIVNVAVAYFFGRVRLFDK